MSVQQGTKDKIRRVADVVQRTLMLMPKLMRSKSPWQLKCCPGSGGVAWKHISTHLVKTVVWQGKQHIGFNPPDPTHPGESNVRLGDDGEHSLGL